MMFRRATTGLATALLAMTLLAACGSDEPSADVPENCEPAHQFKTVEEGVLTVSAYSLPPFSVIRGDAQGVDGIPVSQGAEMGGVDGELLAEIAAAECLELRVNATAAAAVLSTVQAGQADVAAADWFRTVQRASILDLSDPVYLDEVGIISADGASDFAKLRKDGARVGTVLGYMYVDDLRDYFGNDLVLYNSPLTMYQELRAGNLDAGVESAAVGAAYVEGTNLKSVVAEPHEEIHFTLEPGQSTFPVRQGNTALLEALNANIAELRESGRIAEVLEANGLDPAAADPGKPRLFGD